jgi:ribosomal protein S12 methylthiotransferase
VQPGLKYIDIPLQHINDRMLKAMGRRINRAKTEALLQRIRRRVPDVTIRTTFIVGFPGETEAEFHELLEFVRGFGFDAAGRVQILFRGRNAAARMKEQLPRRSRRSVMRDSCWRSRKWPWPQRGAKSAGRSISR